MDPLSGPQRNRLIKALQRFDRPQLNQLLNSIDQNLTLIAGQSTDRDEVATAVSIRAGDEFWEAKLIVAGFAMRPQDPDLATLHAVFRPRAPAAPAAAPPAAESPPAGQPPPGGQPPAGDPFQAVLIRRKTPFIMREDLRSHLRSLVAGSPGRVLVVRGERFSGKSHTKEFVRHLRDALQIFKIYEIEVAPGHTENDPPEPLTAAQLLNELRALFGDPPAEVLSKFQDQKWEEAANGIAKWLRATFDDGVTRWIVIDGFDKCYLAGGAKDLVDAIANRIDSDLDSARLILLGYTESLPAAYEEQIDKPSAAHTAKQDVLEFLKGLYAKAGKSLDDNDVLELVLSDALEVLDGTGHRPSDLGKIGPRLREKALRETTVAALP